MNFEFGTKGETLARLRPLLTIPALCDQTIFNVSDWERDSEQLLQRISGQFGDVRLVVRSCAQDEDGASQSMAGAYTSVIGVANECSAVKAAVAEVIASYRDRRGDNQVLVQPMVENVVVAGVLMTRELNSGAPYYSINYDDSTGRTDSVTGGAESKAFLVRRSHIEAVRSPRFKKLLLAVQEIERITGQNRLDIEFCISRSDEVYILQVRPIAAESKWSEIDDRDVDDLLDATSEQIRAMMDRQSNLFGETTIFGEMPDWNPAEMLGSHPRPMALSLYKRLITDGTWARARARMGYRSVGEIPLLIEFAGRPYIDVRKSLNSFLPADLPEGFGERLVNWQCQLLRDNPHWHDKIEFHIAITCADFSLATRLKKLEDAGFDPRELAGFGEALRKLTGEILRDAAGQLDGLQSEVARLDDARREAAKLDAKQRALKLLGDCVPFGTLPFSCAARHAFIAVSLLRSLVERGALTEEDSGRFLRSVHTIAADIVHDMHALVTGEIDRADFLRRHGHLRPGTYDILSHRYDEAPDLYLGHAKGAAATVAPSRFDLSPSHRTAVEGLLSEFDFECTPEALFDYMARAIALRESAKYEFTKHVSDALLALSEWGSAVGLTREQVAFLTIEQVENERGDYARLASAAQERHELTSAARLPHLLVNESDINVVRLPLGLSNFITRSQVTAPVKLLSAHEVGEIDGRIVLIESADPGFDWIFSHDIKGLITKYGGANSHMSIRCAEFGLPAAIGCGERLFDMVMQAHVVELNCSSRIIRVVK